MQPREKFLPYAMHWINEDDIEAARQVLKGDWITQGPKINLFELSLASYLGSKHAVAVNSCTSALELAARACGVKEGTNIVTTPLSFVASANAALFNNADVRFVDIEKDTFNIDAACIEEKINAETAAILPVHFAGQCCDMQKIGKIAKKHGLAVIEDSAHALGAEFEGKKAGTFGDASCFSFHPAKHITMGEGGAIATSDEKIFERLLLLRNHGIDNDLAKRSGEEGGYAYDVRELSRNSRANDIGCALALSQLSRIGELLKRRAEIAEAYNNAFEGVEGITVPKVVKNRVHAWHIYCVLVEHRDELFRFLRSKNIGANVHYIPIYRHSLYKKKYGLKPEMFPNAEFVFERILTLPLFPKMSNEDIGYVVESVKEGLKKAA